MLEITITMRNTILNSSFFLLLAIGFSCHGENNKNETIMTDKNYELATFGGGCFWCTEAMFDQLNGVITAQSGYSGGTKVNPTYEEVCSGTTGHAEVIQVKFDPNVISYLELLEVFFKTHDPTTKNQQGADKGTQYRSVILYHSTQQKNDAEKILMELKEAHIWENPIVTETVPFEKFYSAEAYHQEYFVNNPQNSYCQLVVTPKVAKFEKLFKDKLKK
jgi:peptide-methionine (S)-S-oxide reductase